MMNEINLLVDPTYFMTYWYKNSLEGIRQQANRRGLAFNVHTAHRENFEQLIEKMKKNSRIALVLGASAMWETDVVKFLCANQLHPLLVSSQFTDNRCAYSCVTLNHFEAAYDITRYLIGEGSRRIAFFGMNPDTLPDILKRSGFSKALADSNIPFIDRDIYINKGCIQDNVQAFLKNVSLYDAILCTNDIVAIILMRGMRLAGNNILEHFLITGFGNTLAGKIFSPSLTTVSLDYIEVGRQAVELYVHLSKNPSIMSSSINVKSQIIVRESTGNRIVDIPTSAMVNSTATYSVNFYDDPQVQCALSFETVLQQSDYTDIAIVQGLYL